MALLDAPERDDRPDGQTIRTGFPAGLFLPVGPAPFVGPAFQPVSSSLWDRLPLWDRLSSRSLPPCGTGFPAGLFLPVGPAFQPISSSLWDRLSSRSLDPQSLLFVPSTVLAPSPPPPSGGGGLWPRAKRSAARGSPIPPKKTLLPRQGQRNQSPALRVVPVGSLSGRPQPTGQCRQPSCGGARSLLHYLSTFSLSADFQSPHSAPKRGRWIVATGEAQRSPWIADPPQKTLPRQGQRNGSQASRAAPLVQSSVWDRHCLCGTGPPCGTGFFCGTGSLCGTGFPAGLFLPVGPAFQPVDGSSESSIRAVHCSRSFSSAPIRGRDRGGEGAFIHGFRPDWHRDSTRGHPPRPRRGRIPFGSR